MSRIGRLPITVPAGVTVTMDGNVCTVKGEKGSINQEIQNHAIKVNVEGNTVHVTRDNDVKSTKAAHGLYRALIANMVEGVSKGFTKALIINGVGYKAQMQGKDLILNVGYSHPVTVVAPEGITLSLADKSTTEIKVSGIDKTIVGQCAANIKDIRRPEPYHGYGIQYKDETILRKEGKKQGK